VFKFVGGPKDGQTLVAEPGQSSEAERYYLLTHRGRVGQRIRTASEYAIETLSREQLQEERPHHFHEHVYEVTQCLEDDEKVFVLVDYVAPGN